MKSEDSKTETPTAVGSSALLGAAYRGSDGAMTCALCHAEMEWEECGAGCEDGYFDAYEEDPLFYDPGDLLPCHQCNGQGGSWWCPEPQCPNKDVIRIIPAPQAPNDKLRQDTAK